MKSTNTRGFDDLLTAATQGKLSRRALLRRAVVLGLSAPAISAILAACGSSSSSSSGSSSSASSAAATSAAATSTTGGSGSGGGSTPTSGSGTASAETTATSSAASGGKRGDSGELRILWWQAPTVLNPAFSNGTKDYDASRLILEPLFDRDKDNKLVPVLAAEAPSLDNGQVAKDGTSLTVKLRQGVTWHDGTPFTADDVVFTWKFNSNEKVASQFYANYQQVQTCEAIDDHTVKYTFKAPYAAWFKVGYQTRTLPQHILKGALDNPAQAASDPFNIKPIGTGPYKITDFKPGDVGTYEMYDKYWDPGKPHFAKVIMKGGGDAASAARAVLQTGEEDWAWNLQVDPNVLKSMEAGGKGGIVTAPGGGCERMEINHSDPLKETEGQKSYYKNPHPHFKELKVRQALNYLLDRKTIATTLYGAGGDPTGSPYNTNKDNMPPGIQDYEYSIDKANQLLDQVGAKKGGDGVRTLNGRKMVWVYTTSVNDVRQKTQEIVKDSCKQAGIDMTLKSIDSAVFFGATDNPGSLSVFLADLEMYTNTGAFYPDLWLQRYYSEKPDTYICQKSNSWNGTNSLRYQNPQWNTLYDQTVKEIDPAKYQAGFQQLLKMAVMDDIAECGIVNRKSVSAAASWLDGYQNRGAFSTSEVWDIKSWFKKS